MARQAAEELALAARNYASSLARKPAGLFPVRMFSPKENRIAQDILAAAYVDPDSKSKVALTPEAAAYLREIGDSAATFVLEEDAKTLETFRQVMASMDTPLGRYYAEFFPSVTDMLHENDSNRSPAFYSNLLLWEAASHQPRLKKALSQIERIEGRQDLLHSIGSDADTMGLHEECLSPAEMGLTPLVVLNGLVFPFASGMRYGLDGLLWMLGMQPGSLLEETHKAHRRAVSTSAIVGWDGRDNFSSLPDAAFTIECLNPPERMAHFVAKQRALREHLALQAVAPALYGSEYVGSKTRGSCTTLEFDLPHFGPVSFYCGAYKARTKKAIEQALVIGNHRLSEPGTYNLKGMGLGAFGISQIIPQLEALYIEALAEVLQERHLPNIKKLVLLNFPSTLAKIDQRPGDISYIASIGYEAGAPNIDMSKTRNPDMLLSYQIGPALGAVSGELATHINADGGSCIGNENNYRNKEGSPLVPAKVSSDESVFDFATGGTPSLAHWSTLTLAEKQARSFALSEKGARPLVDALSGEAAKEIEEEEKAAMLSMG
jgi:hypothetical protein